MSPRVKQPKFKRGERVATPEHQPDYNAMRPVFVLQHVLPGHSLKACPDKEAATFGRAIEHRAQLTWRELTVADNKGAGLHQVRVSAIRTNSPLPKNIVTPDVDKLDVFNCGGVRRIIGLRQNEKFIVLMFDHDGRCYDH